VYFVDPKLHLPPHRRQWLASSGPHPWKHATPTPEPRWAGHHQPRFVQADFRWCRGGGFRRFRGQADACRRGPCGPDSPATNRQGRRRRRGPGTSRTQPPQPVCGPGSLVLSTVLPPPSLTRVAVTPALDCASATPRQPRPWTPIRTCGRTLTTRRARRLPRTSCDPLRTICGPARHCRPIVAGQTPMCG
jgi:hypothetical protein